MPPVRNPENATGKTIAHRLPTIAHTVNPFLFATGSWVYNQVKGLKAFAAIVLTTKTENLGQFPFEPLCTTEDLGPVRRMAEKTFRRLFNAYLPCWAKACRDHEARVLHSHFGNFGWQDMGLAAKLNIPHVVSFYGADMSKLPRADARWYKRYEALFKTATAVIAEGPCARNALLDLGCPPEKALVNRIGVDLDAIVYKERRPLPDGKIRVLVAGTFTEKKGIPFAIEAFGLALQKHPSMRLTLVGDANRDTEQQLEKKKIFDLVDGYGLGDRLDWLGYIPYRRLLEIAYDHDVFLSPSVTASSGDTEGGSPVVITEMVASGVPVVSTRHADIPEVVIDGQSGFLAAERDAGALAESLCRLARFPERIAQMGREGRRHVESGFSLAKQIEGLEQIYGELTGLRP